MWYQPNCYYCGKPDTSQEFGRKQKYFRCSCEGKGLRNNLPCIHAYKDNKRLIPRRKGITRGSVVVTYRNDN